MPPWKYMVNIMKAISPLRMKKFCRERGYAISMVSIMFTEVPTTV